MQTIIGTSQSFYHVPTINKNEKKSLNAYYRGWISKLMNAHNYDTCPFDNA